MTFVPPFSRVFSPTFDRRNASAAANAWWTLNGVIPAVNCIAAYQPKGAADIATSYINLANPGTYNAAPGIAPSFASATGWTFNGSTQYLTTGLTVNSADGWSLFVRFNRTAHTSNAGIVANAANYFTGFGFYSYNAGSLAVSNVAKYYAAIANTLGVEQTLAICSLALYINGTFDRNISGSGSNANAEVFIGRNSTTTYYTGSIYAIAIYNNSQASNAAALTTAMNAL